MKRTTEDAVVKVLPRQHRRHVFVPIAPTVEPGRKHDATALIEERG
jgi:hypothetical protein